MEVSFKPVFLPALMWLFDDVPPSPPRWLDDKTLIDFWGLNRRFCVDGKIVLVPQGGWVEVRANETGGEEDVLKIVA